MENSISYLLTLIIEIFGINPLVFLLLMGDPYSLNKIENSNIKIHFLEKLERHKSENIINSLEE
jgi:hypothetical protein